MSSYGWFDYELLPVATFDAEIDPLAWFDRSLAGFEDKVRISQSFVSWFDDSSNNLSWFDPDMEQFHWFGDDGGSNDFPTLTGLNLSIFAASPYSGSPFHNFGSNGTSSTRNLISRSGAIQPSIGASANGRTSAYYDSTATEATGMLGTDASLLGEMILGEP